MNCLVSSFFLKIDLHDLQTIFSIFFVEILSVKIISDVQFEQMNTSDHTI